MPNELVTAVRQHALAHYNESAWDVVIECWEDADILKAIGDAREAGPGH